MSCKVDFTQQVFTGYYEHKGVKYCYTVYPEFYYHVNDAEMHYRDRVNVMAVTPYKGTMCFALHYDRGKWRTITAYTFVDEKPLKMINDNMKKVTEKKPIVSVTKTKSL